MWYGKYEAEDEPPLTDEEIKRLRKIAKEQAKKDDDDFSLTQHYFHDDD